VSNPVGREIFGEGASGKYRAPVPAGFDGKLEKGATDP